MPHYTNLFDDYWSEASASWKRTVLQANRDYRRIVRTADLMVRMIELAMLTLAEADAIKDDWAANYRFRIPVASFAEMM